jgi:hypothetical protein
MARLYRIGIVDSDGTVIDSLPIADFRSFALSPEYRAELVEFLIDTTGVQERIQDEVYDGGPEHL